MLQLIAPALASFFVTVLAIVALRPLAIAIDLIDRPGGRKTHHGEVPIVGGLAMFLGVVLGIGLVPLPGASGGAFLAAATVLVTIGLLDDRFELSPWARLPAQIAVATVLMFGSSVVVTTLGSPFGDEEITLVGMGSYAFTVFIIISAINAFNMLDGMDGLAGATAVIALAGLSYLAWSGGLPTAAAASLVIAGAVSAFLIFNVPVRFNRVVRCFMGDAGSTLLGFTVAWLCISVSQAPGPTRAASPITALWVVALPLYELCWSFFRRLLRGVSPFKADNNHFHHLLLRAGFGVRGAFIVFIVLAAILATFGIMWDRANLPDSYSFGLLVLTGVGVVLLMYKAEVLWHLMPESLRHLPPLEAAVVVTKSRPNAK